MIGIDRQMINKIIIFVASAGATISLLYLINLEIIKSPVVLGLLLSVIYIMAYSILLMLFSIVYRYAYNIGKPLPGIFTMMFGHLKQKQIENLSRSKAFMYEYILMRMDIIVPAGILFGITIFATTPTPTTNIQLSQLVISEIAGIFTLSYLGFTMLQSWLLSIKFDADVVQEQILTLDYLRKRTFDE